MNRNFSTVVSLIVVTCLTRLPFAAKCLCTHDSVNFALGIKEFNLEKHQPHPPGYILYVGLGKLLHLFVRDPNKDLIALSIVFSCGAVVLIYMLGKEMLNYRCGVVSALFLISSPLFWAHGALPVSYAADAFGSLLIAYTGYRTMKGNREYALATSLALGLAGGIRQSLLLYFVPMWMAVVISLRSLKEAAKQALVLAAACLSWLVPLVLLSGGPKAYLEISQRLYKGSVLAHFGNLKTMAYASCSSLWGLGFAVIALIWSIHAARRIRSGLRKELVTFYVVCWGGPILFSYLLFMGNSGYALAFTPCFTLLSSLFVYERGGRSRHVLVGSIVLANCLLFLLVSPLPVGGRVVGIKMDRYRNFANFWALDYSRDGIKRQGRAGEVLDSVKRGFSPDTTAIAVGDPGTFEPWIPLRVVQYYLPGFPIVAITGNRQVVRLRSNTSTVVWLIHERDLRKYNNAGLHARLLGKGQVVYFSRVRDRLSFGLSEFYRGSD
ncbi:MAG: glycosyltransferase family 39 protein [Candidatus Eisenbacteria bacterium]|nr:glycosyltransferase family 39 protein [Candidatus Eisenbacteria bacterium]